MERICVGTRRKQLSVCIEQAREQRLRWCLCELDPWFCPSLLRLVLGCCESKGPGRPLPHPSASSTILDWSCSRGYFRSTKSPTSMSWSNLAKTRRVTHSTSPPVVPGSSLHFRCRRPTGPADGCPNARVPAGFWLVRYPGFELCWNQHRLYLAGTPPFAVAIGPTCSPISFFSWPFASGSLE